MRKDKIIEINFKGGIYRIRKDFLLYILQFLKSNEKRIIEKDFSEALIIEEDINKDKSKESTTILNYLKNFKLNDECFLTNLEKISLKSIARNKVCR